ncbi:N-acetylmuramoyl-L-alanine amidase [Bacteroides reticulotermitis]|uniref:N-acetylmuramoyl-L-alanine amidase n=2 Tax=Bacteroides reticulotermitis TaxID=1133319 RepID=W4URL1_9BACE|nr:N-acetylmuramoyl-L-alanine amidase [Bacteroides reticulotermitis]MBB4044501.1 N-acetyl-anhydromuramyl-L-alanine amidase AmpD [Bacteroides reticulotermitis]GAE83273.1 N-acetylmuramoyl-L-alanine amidase [Bacteroides reticulotermitis JCM 10512]
MRKLNLIVVHCSATREDCTLSPEALDLMHRRRGFTGTGYHYYIRKDGTVHLTRPVERIGAHVKGFNANSIGVCYEGGLDCRGRPADTRTSAQKASLLLLIHQLQQRFPGCRVCGHRDLSPDLNGNGEIEPEEWIKACPCFDVETLFQSKNE